MNITRILLSSILTFFLFTSLSSAASTYRIGTWNLEHFHSTKTRGFPESPGRYGPRGKRNYEYIASVIKNLDIKILALQEINAEYDEDYDGYLSPELDDLLTELGSDYDYVIGTTGGTQHVAILYNHKFAELNTFCETSFRNYRVQKKGLFDRQPIYGHFTFLDGTTEKNDLVVMSVHLASGQHNYKNHKRAMNRIVREIKDDRAEEFCIPSDEYDVVIMGDYNANRFDNHDEEFWDDMERNNKWDVLGGDTAATYSPTRLSGKNKPLDLYNSRIDYIIVTSHSRRHKGLSGEEIVPNDLTIHTELLSIGNDEFRELASDHLPVTVEVKVISDTD